ncbi:MAG: ATP-binding protein [Oscillospiraceae bacterium]|nr:ATP-binding protein [Oscillospiraceae bacterium]
MENEKITVLQYLLSLRTENEWLEYKHNNTDPDMIGEYISALSNSAILEGQDKAYLIYGVDNDTKEPIGTTFNFKSAKKGNEELENYILTQLEPRINFRVFDLYVNNNKIVMFEIDTNTNIPV